MSSSTKFADYHFSATVPVYDVVGYKRIACALDIDEENAFPRTKPDVFDSTGVIANNYGEYISDTLAIELQPEIAIIYFRDLDVKYISHIMLCIQEALMLPEDSWEIVDDRTEEAIDLDTITSVIKGTDFTYEIMFSIRFASDIDNVKKAFSNFDGEVTIKDGLTVVFKIKCRRFDLNAIICERIIKGFGDSHIAVDTGSLRIIHCLSKREVDAEGEYI